MLNDREWKTLDAAIARIVPDDDGSARTFVAGRATLQTELYRAAVFLLESRGFVDLVPEEQDRLLRELESHPSVALLVQHAVEGFYTSPAGFEAVGFRVTV